MIKLLKIQNNLKKTLSKLKSFIKHLHLRGFLTRRNLLLSLIVCSLITLIYLFWDLPNPKNLTSHPAPSSTKLLDRHGSLIYEIFVDERRTPIQLKSLPNYVWQATLAAEDKNFYQHGGFSISGIGRAFVNTFFKKSLQGGSTITQQLVRTALLTQDRTVKRKIREFTLSIVVETLYNKDEILEMYLNQVPYGGTAYGIESASQTYFGKHAADLNVAEATLLAGLTQAPSYYSPFGSHPELAKVRQKYVLDQMLDGKFLTENEHASASAIPITYATDATLKAPHFSLWVKDLLIQKYGLNTVENGGLIVTTTLDKDLQDYSQNIMATEIAKLKKEKVGNGAALVTHPKTGEILAMIGSKDYFNLEDDGNVNVVLSQRQPGSSIKPITYAIGIDRKLFTASTVLADKATCFLQPDQKPYCPDNYDNQFHGPTQVRFALGNSFNIPAVKALVLNGLSDFVASSSAFGLTTFKDPAKYGSSITLGGGEVTMLDLATAYSVLANSGQKVLPNPILQIKDSTGKILEQAPLKELPQDQLSKTLSLDLISLDSKLYTSLPRSNVRVISSGAAYITTHLLLDNGARSATFGSSSYLNIKGHPEVAVKTGTTNDKRDNWTLGYTQDILAAVWVGNNDNSEMSAVASGVTGASPIWNKIITYALKNYPQHWPTQPADVVGTSVCSLSGLKVPQNPDPGCTPRYEYFLTGTVPPFDGGSRRDIPIFKPTNTPATPKQQLESPGEIENQNHAVIFDGLGLPLCLDCAGGYGAADTIRLDARGKALPL